MQVSAVWGGKQHFSIRSAIFFRRLEVNAVEPFLNGARAFVGSQNALAGSHQRLGGSQKFLVHGLLSDRGLIQFPGMALFKFCASCSAGGRQCNQLSKNALRL